MTYSRLPILKIIKFTGSALTFVIILNSCALKPHACSNNWMITGYFTPFESDYSIAPKQKIYIEQLGYSDFSQHFLKATKIQGWGKTNAGWYLGYFSKKWHKSSHPLNAGGKPLKTGSIATDRRYIERERQVNIPTLPKIMKHQIFTADDVGSAIKGHHVDIYTGEGKQAEKLAWKITGKQHTVCKL